MSASVGHQSQGAAARSADKTGRAATANKPQGDTEFRQQVITKKKSGKGVAGSGEPAVGAETNSNGKENGIQAEASADRGGRRVGSRPNAPPRMQSNRGGSSARGRNEFSNNALWTLAIVSYFLFAAWFIPPTSSIAAVTVSSEDLTCWTPETLAWSLTCKVTVLDDSYVSSVQVMALDRFGLHSIIAKCSRGTYLFASFAQFMGPSGSQCPLPREQKRMDIFKVPFSFTNVSANSDGRLSFPVRNISCGARVYSSDDYYPYLEQLSQDLIQCVKPTMELPSTYNFVDGSVAMVTCSARNAIPEARILLTITSATSQSWPLQSTSGVNNATITINTSSKYHRAAVNCTVLNHAHYLAPKMSEILVYYISRKASEVESQALLVADGDVLNCTDSVDSYPDAEFKWYMDNKLSGTESSFSVPCSTASTEVQLECVATNSATNESVHVAFNITCNNQHDNLLVVVFTCVPILLVLVITVVFIVRLVRRNERRKCIRRQQPKPTQDCTTDYPTATNSAGAATELYKLAPLDGGAPWSGDDAWYDMLSLRSVLLLTV